MATNGIDGSQRTTFRRLSGDSTPPPELNSEETKGALTFHMAQTSPGHATSVPQPLSESKVAGSGSPQTEPAGRQRKSFVRILQGLQGSRTGKDRTGKLREKADKHMIRFMEANANPKTSLDSKLSLAKAAIKARHELANLLSQSQDPSEAEEVQLLQECVNMYDSVIVDDRACNEHKVTCLTPLMEQVTARACSLYGSLGEVPNCLHATFYQCKAREMLFRRHFFGGSLTASERERMTGRELESGRDSYYAADRILEVLAARSSIVDPTRRSHARATQGSRDQAIGHADKLRSQYREEVAKKRQEYRDGFLKSVLQARLALLPDNSLDELKLLKECLDVGDLPVVYKNNDEQALLPAIAERAYTLHSKLGEDSGPRAALHRLKAHEMLVRLECFDWLTSSQREQLNSDKQLPIPVAFEFGQERLRMESIKLRVREMEEGLERVSSVDLHLTDIAAAITKSYVDGERNGSSHAYAKAGKLADLKRLVQSGAHVDELDADGYTPLMWAAQNGRLDVVEFLIGAGALIQVDGARRGHESCLFLAAEQGHFNVVEVLLKKGANFNWARDDGETPLIAALKRNPDAEVAALLLAYVATAHHEAVANNDPNEAALLLACAHRTTRDGRSALHYAVQNGHREIVASLLESAQPADVNRAERGDGNTPLMYAVERGDLPVVELLLQAGASLAPIRKDGSTLLLLAAGHGHLDIAKRVLHFVPGLIDQARHDGRTAVMEAAANGHAVLTVWLQNNGGDANQRDSSGNTALAYLASALTTQRAGVPKKRP